MPCGDHLGAAFELADYLRAHDDDRLLAAVLGVAPDVVLEERSQPGPTAGPWPRANSARPPGWATRATSIPGWRPSSSGATVERPLTAVLETVAREAGVERGDMAAAALPIVRRLVERAFLLPRRCPTDQKLLVRLQVEPSRHRWFVLPDGTAGSSALDLREVQENCSLGRSPRLVSVHGHS